MRFPLVRKELREQRPFAAFGLFLAATELLDAAMDGLAAHPLARTWNGSCPAAYSMVMLLAFAMGTGLLVREQDDGTLGFLDGLPLTRARMFGVKLLVGYLVLLSYPVANLVLQLLLHAAGRDELDAAFHLPVLSGQLALNAVLVLAALAMGMWLGFFRSLSWFLLAVLFVGLGYAQRQWPVLAALDPGELCAMPVVGARFELGAEDVAGPLAEAAIALACAWWLFSGSAGWLQRALAEVPKRPVLSAVFAALTVAGGFFAVLANQRSDKKAAPASTDAPTFSEGALALRQTTHYRFHYPGASAAAAQQLAERADADFEEVHRRLGVAPGAPIDADLSGSSENTDGTAFHERVRVALNATSRETLVHETVHVLARRVATSGDRNVWDRLTVFNEGLAHWVGRPYGSPRRAVGDRLVAAALYARGEVVLDELMDEDKLAERRDRGVKYALGAALVEALVQRHGEGAVRKVLEAAATDTLRADLSGPTLYQAVFQLAGFDLALVFDDLFKVLEADKEALRATLDALPRPRALVVKADEGWFGIQPQVAHAPPEGWSVVVRFRPRPDSPLETYVTRTPSDDGVAWRQRRDLARKEICFQAGLRSPHGVALYEPWQCLPLSSAQPVSPQGAAEQDAGAP
jgi:hypothetical protein